MSKTKVPAIPAPTDANLREVARALKGVVDVREGLLGDPLDKAVTFRDLVDGGIVEPVIVSRGGGSGAISVGPAPGLSSGGSGSSPEPDLTPPPAPTGLAASAGIAVIILEWDAANYSNHAFTEIWRSEDNVLGNAVRVATTEASLYADNLGATGAQRYYWARHRSTADVAGPYNDTNGVAATTGKIGNVDLGPLIVEAGNLASGAVNTSKLASDAITAGVFAPGYQPIGFVESLPPALGYTGPNTVFQNSDSKVYRYDGVDFTSVVEAIDIDSRGLDIKDITGNIIFASDGEIAPTAYVDVNNNNVLISDVAANSLVPSLNYVGAFSTAPTSTTLGAAWKQNAVYKNTLDGKSYVLTGAPLAWVEYLADGQLFLLTIESTNGTIFRVGQNTSTLLKARLFKNGAEVTDVTPEAWFRWRRVSALPQAPPNDDATWNASYQSGYRQISINVDAVYARATFFCDIVSP